MINYILLLKNCLHIIKNIILKACAKNPKNRYDSVKEMYDDLKTCLDSERVRKIRLDYIKNDRIKISVIFWCGR